MVFYHLIKITLIVRVVLQFHGCYWHGCPRCYRINRDTRLVVGNETMDDRYEKTCKISEKIRSYNYNLIKKWMCEYEKECLENESMRQFVQEVNLKMHVTLNPRNSFFSGRTGNTAKVYDVQDNQKFKYIDVCSLYPYICKRGKTPLVIQKYMSAKKSVLNSLVI